jgi:putative transcriptional regulator
MKINVTKMLISMAEFQMSVNELAEKSGVSRGTVSAIKAGKTCRPDIAGKIAQALDKPLAELIED